MTTVNENELVAQAKAGNRSAFEKLIRRTSRLVFARLYLDTGDTHQAEDLLQETLIRAYRSLDRLQKPEQFRSWLLAIAQNVATDAVRHASRKKRGPPNKQETLDDVQAQGPGPAESAAQKEERRRVLAVLRSLPEDYRLPLTLRYIAGADYQTIEVQLGLTNGALRGLLHRGLNMLREKLTESADD